MYDKHSTAVVICPIIVAKAAPVIPMSNVKINKGSNIMFIIVPIIMLRIVYAGFPSALIIVVKAMLTAEKGRPINIILVYSIA